MKLVDIFIDGILWITIIFLAIGIGVSNARISEKDFMFQAVVNALLPPLIISLTIVITHLTKKLPFDNSKAVLGRTTWTLEAVLNTFYCVCAVLFTILEMQLRITFPQDLTVEVVGTVIAGWIAIILSDICASIALSMLRRWFRKLSENNWDEQARYRVARLSRYLFAMAALQLIVLVDNLWYDLQMSFKDTNFMSACLSHALTPIAVAFRLRLLCLLLLCVFDFSVLQKHKFSPEGFKHLRHHEGPLLLTALSFFAMALPLVTGTGMFLVILVMLSSTTNIDELVQSVRNIRDFEWLWFVLSVVQLIFVLMIWIRPVVQRWFNPLETHIELHDPVTGSPGYHTFDKLQPEPTRFGQGQEERQQLLTTAPSPFLANPVIGIEEDQHEVANDLDAEETGLVEGKRDWPFILVFVMYLFLYFALLAEYCWRTTEEVDPRSFDVISAVVNILAILGTFATCLFAHKTMSAKKTPANMLTFLFQLLGLFGLFVIQHVLWCLCLLIDLLLRIDPTFDIFSGTVFPAWFVVISFTAVYPLTLEFRNIAAERLAEALVACAQNFKQ